MLVRATIQEWITGGLNRADVELRVLEDAGEDVGAKICDDLDSYIWPEVA